MQQGPKPGAADAGRLARERLDALSELGAEQRDEIRAQSAQIRREIESVVVPADMRDEVARAIATLGDKTAYAVRSSATAEDLPTASFAGQYDTYLNVVGADEIGEDLADRAEF